MPRALSHLGWFPKLALQERLREQVPRHFPRPPPHHPLGPTGIWDRNVPPLLHPGPEPPMEAMLSPVRVLPWAVSTGKKRGCSSPACNALPRVLCSQWGWVTLWQAETAGLAGRGEAAGHWQVTARLMFRAQLCHRQGVDCRAGCPVCMSVPAALGVPRCGWDPWHQGLCVLPGEVDSGRGGQMAQSLASAEPQGQVQAVPYAASPGSAWDLLE